MFEFLPINFDLDGDGIADVEALVADTDGDGQIDTMSFDTTGDGFADTTITMLDDSSYAVTALLDNGTTFTTVMTDTDHNGVIDSAISFADVDGDGNPDIITRMYDYDQDGVFDSRTTYVDTDGDADFDMVVKEWDTDGDGVMDHSKTSYDFNGDHRPDVVETYAVENGEIVNSVAYMDTNGDGTLDTRGVISPDGEVTYFHNLATSAAAGVEDVVNPAIGGVYVDELQRFDPGTANADTTLGDPSSSMETWECQGNTNRCAIFAQKFVIEELTGEDIPADELAALAEENNWFSEESGTPLLNMNKLLDHFGIENEVSYHNTSDDLREALASGNKVITCIDADEIWYGEDNDIFSPTDGPNHAVEIIGIDESDADNPMVILNDSGHENGCGEMVPMDVFLGAWEDGNCMMITC